MVWWLGLCAPNAGSLGSIPGEGIRPHMPQLKILHATMKTQHRQINKNKYFHKTKTLASGKNSYDKPRQCIKKQRHHFADKGLSSQSYGFPVVMYGFESWTITKAEC